MSDTRARNNTGLLLCLLLLGSGDALAIPSPDLVINLSASAAQLLGLLGALFGGFALSLRKKARRTRKGFGTGGKLMLGTAGLMLAASLLANVLQYTGFLDNTTPHEYPIDKQPGNAPAHDGTQKAQELTLASYIVAPVRAVLDYMVDITGHYALGLLGIVLMIRIVLLPLALKADRDARVQKSLSGRIAELRDELSENPSALSDATLHLYKRFHIRPVVNTLASLLQLSLLLLFYSAVSQSSTAWEHGFLWFDAAASHDPLLIMPAVAAALFVGVLASQSPARSLRKALLYALAGAVLFWLLQPLGAAINLYLAISMGLLILQGTLFKVVGNTLGWDTAGSYKKRSIKDTGLIELRHAHYLPDATGKKASRLGQLMEAGYNVPNGFVFTSEITNRIRRAPDQPLLTKSLSRKLDQLWQGLSTGHVAVRSSGAYEDGTQSSFAGVYESILNVSREELEGAVRTVYQSLGSDYSAAHRLNTMDEGMPIVIDQGGVVVQKMVDAEFAGVMFTEHPGTTGAMMVEMVTGLGDDLVNGNVTPDTFVFGKLSSQLLEEESSSIELPPMDLAPLLALGRELEAMFEHPQDIEWAYAKGQYYLLQARDITRSISTGNAPKNIAERERAKLLKNLLGERKRVRRSDRMILDEPVFVQSELAELLPRPTLFSADFMERLWAAGGSTDMACQDLGIPYNVHPRSAPYLNTIFGWTYVNKHEERRRLGKGPGALTLFRLARDAESMEAEFHEQFLPVFQNEMIERNAMAMERLTLEAATTLFSNWVRRFVENTYCTAERINISADYHMKAALNKLASANLEPSRYLNDDQETVVSHAMSLLSAQNVSAETIDEFLLIFGHRAPLDYEFSEPRFNEDMDLVKQYIERSSQATHTQLDEELLQLPDNKALTLAVQRARSFIRLKEEAKHYCLIELAQIRRLLLAIDAKCQFEGLIFQLRVDEVTQLTDTRRREQLQISARRRFEEAQICKDLQLPASLSVSDLEQIDMLTGSRPDTVEQSELAGKRVAGKQEVIGTVRVITDIEQIHTFKPGEILVARMTDPTWYPLFSQARGIVTEIGGWLSHAAIVAREHDLPAIVGVPRVCQRLNDGDIIRMSINGSVDIMHENKATDSPASVEESTDPPQTLSTFEQLRAFMSDETTPSEFYQLTAHKLMRYQQGIERRAMKDELGDRRFKPRFTAHGEIERDRRAANRAANAAMLKKAS